MGIPIQKRFFAFSFLLSLLIIFKIPLYADEEIRGELIITQPAIEETSAQIMDRDDTPGDPNELIIQPRPLVPPIVKTEDILTKGFPEVAPPTTNDATTLTRSPQTVGPVNFTSVTLADTLSLPPDSNGGVGPSQFLTVVNGRIRTHSKATGAMDNIINTTLDSFFNSVRNGVRTTDPRVKFDRVTNRWFIVCINVQQPGPNRILLAVSNAGIITGTTVWRFFFLDHSVVPPIGDTGLFFDFPTLGIDANALYIGGNLFDSNNFYVNSTAIVIQKTSALATGPLVATAFRNLINTGGPVTPQGVTNFDSAPLQGFFIGNVNSSFLGLRIISNPGTTTPTMSSVVFIPITATAAPPDVPCICSGPNLLDSVGDRLAEAHIRASQLWITHNIGLDSTGTSTGTITRTGIRWYQFNITSPNAPTLTQSGTLFHSAPVDPNFYWMPSLMTSGQNHMALGFSVGGEAQFANAGTVGRLVGYGAGTLGSIVFYTNSSTAYNVQSGVQRWGDYSITSLDPQDNMTMWTIQEFCDATNSYGCQVAQLRAPPPASISSANPSQVPRQSSVNINIFGISNNGSGFYDPGAGFAKRLTATVSGGVIVNSVTFVSPTFVTLNLNTQFASTGLKIVTIRNPDNQQTTNSVFSVV